MYKLLLCVRYLQTRYLAFICIVSVMLGVATLIVVNAVMSGFSTKLKDRLHGVLSDVVIDTDRPDGFEVRDDKGNSLTPDQIIDRIMKSGAGPQIEAVTPTIEAFAILQFRYRGTVIAKPVRLIGIDPEGRTQVGGFSEYLVRQKDAPRPSFELTPDALQRHAWNVEQFRRENGPNVPAPKVQPLVADPNAIPEPKMEIDRGIEQPKLHGVIVGYTIAHFRYKDESGNLVEEAALKEGDDVIITTAGGQELKPVWGSFYVTDYLKTEMSEYDQSFVYVPLEQLQRIRGMMGRATAFQIKLKNYDRDKESVGKELRGVFKNSPEVRIATWEEHQGPLLAAIDVERGILNLLLFMIVGVAGFSILAIFTMIVSEKYRDIGIMKSLGASSWGVMQIFLGYGLLLGTVGCALGTGLGLWITRNINDIEKKLTAWTGTSLFPRDVYYFKEIPTNIDPATVVLVNVGAVVIAAVFSLLPAWRAARLQPVRALRFE
ncbi:MAG: ABC transporter permease [Planctomycetes bacterium]|nr:ABC transporter permease [Planctomycetota bacterium]